MHSAYVQLDARKQLEKTLKKWIDVYFQIGREECPEAWWACTEQDATYGSAAESDIRCALQLAADCHADWMGFASV